VKKALVEVQKNQEHQTEKIEKLLAEKNTEKKKVEPVSSQVKAKQAVLEKVKKDEEEVR
jgi:hypothetical protein